MRGRQAPIEEKKKKNNIFKQGERKKKRKKNTTYQSLLSHRSLLFLLETIECVLEAGNLIGQDIDPLGYGRAR